MPRKKTSKNRKSVNPLARQPEAVFESFKRLAKVPASAVSSCVFQRSIRGKMRWVIDFEHVRPAFCRTKGRMRRIAKNQTRRGAEAEARQLLRQCVLEAELVVGA